MKKTNQVLVAVNLEKNLENQRSMLFAGDWCTFSDEKIRNLDKNLRVFPSIFNKSGFIKSKSEEPELQKFKKEIIRLRKIIQPQLFQELNRINKKNFNNYFWNLIVDPWLGNYLAYMYVKWHTIDKILHSYQNVNFDFSYYKIDRNELVNYDLQNSFIIPNLSSDVYNQYYYQVVVDYFKDAKNLNIVHTDQKLEYQKRKVEFYNKYDFIFKKFINNLKKIILSEDRIYLKSHEITKYDFIKIQLKLKQSPLNPNFYFSDKTFTTIINDDLLNYDNQIRSQIKLEYKKEKNFENFILERIKYDLPNYLVENFEKIYKYVNNLNFYQKTIISGSDHYYNILFKFWIALNKFKGNKIITLDHGIHNGVEKGDIYYQEEIGDLNLGYYKKMKKNEVQIPSIKLSKYINLRSSDIKRKFLLYVTNDNMQYPENILICPIGNQINFVINYFKEFSEYLKEEIKKNIAIRPTIKKHFPNSWIKDKIIKKFSKSYKIIDTNYPEYYKNSKIIICTYPQTSFAEAIISGPTILLTDLKLWPHLDNFPELKADLLDAKIIFEDPINAAKHINKVWDNPYEWWSSKKVENAKKRFINETALVSKDAVTQFANYLSELKNFKDI